MMLFFIGLLIGAILSVIADRLWRQYERIPKLDISCAEYFDATIGCMSKGYEFTITNRGTFEIPPYKIWIYNPWRGSISFFTKNRDESTLPNQKLMHRCAMVMNEKLINILPDLYWDRNNNSPMSEVQKRGFVFRLVLDNSDKIIYENMDIGNAFVKVFQKTRESGSFSGNTFDDMKALQLQYEPFYKKTIQYVSNKINKK
jgi:hypothetical protein